MTDDRPLIQLIAAVGGQAAAARIANISQTAVWKWARYGLPASEFTGESHHLDALIAASPSRHSRRAILDAEREYKLRRK